MPNKRYKKSRLERPGQSWKNSSAINAVSPFTRQTSGPSLDVLGIFVSSICPRIVLTADTMIYLHFWRYLDILWTNLRFPCVQRMANVCPAAAWPDGKWENYEIHTLTHFCLPIFQSILANNNDEKRTKVGSRGQKLDLTGTKLGFWRHILVIYGTRTYLGHMLDIYWPYSRHRTKSGQK